MHCAVSSLEAKSLFLKFKIELKELSFCHKLQFSNLFKFIWYFKHRLFDLAEFLVWNIKGLRLENQSMWQKLNSFWSCFLKIWNQILLRFDFPPLVLWLHYAVTHGMGWFNSFCGVGGKQANLIPTRKCFVQLG